MMHTLSTNENESFHSMIVATAAGGKRYNLGARGSYFTSALCALMCKNDGHTYVGDLYREMGIDPPEAMMHQAIAREAERKRCALRKTTAVYKKNKRLKKEKITGGNRSGSIINLGKEMLPAYKSGCLFEPPVEVGDSDDESDGSSDLDGDVDSVGSGGGAAYASDAEDEEVGMVDVDVASAFEKMLMPHQRDNEETRATFAALIEEKRVAHMDKLFAHMHME